MTEEERQKYFMKVSPTPPDTTVCLLCDAVVADPGKHLEWHKQLTKRLKSNVLT